MTGIIDTVVAALGDEPQSRQALAEATGLELSQVSPALTAARGKGLAERFGDGWIAGSGAVQKVQRHAATSLDATLPRRKVRAAKAAAPKINGGHRTLEFAVSESGAILLRKLGAHEWSEMPQADAEALAKLVKTAA